MQTIEVKREKIYYRLYDVYLDDKTLKNIKDEITFTFSKNYKELILTFYWYLINSNGLVIVRPLKLNFLFPQIEMPFYNGELEKLMKYVRQPKTLRDICKKEIITRFSLPIPNHVINLYGKAPKHIQDEIREDKLSMKYKVYY